MEVVVGLGGKSSPENTPNCRAHLVMACWPAASMAGLAFKVKGCIFQQVTQAHWRGPSCCAAGPELAAFGGGRTFLTVSCTSAGWCHQLPASVAVYR